MAIEVYELKGFMVRVIDPSPGIDAPRVPPGIDAPPVPLGIDAPPVPKEETLKEPESSWVNTSNSEAAKIKQKAQQQNPKKKKRKGGCKQQ